MNYFVEQATLNNMPAPEILNWYRNLYYKEPETTEEGIMARAVNEVLPEYVRLKKENEIKNNWISTEEKPPDKNGEYLCVLKGFCSYRKILHYAKSLKKIDAYLLDKGEKDSDGWYFYDNEYGNVRVRATSVTHWMEIPELPVIRSN